MKNYNGLNNMIMDCFKELFERNSIDGFENIDLDTNLKDLGLDSLDQVELVIDMENKFDIAIPDNDLDNLSDFTIKDISLYLKEKFDIVDIKQERHDKLDEITKAKQNL